MPREYLKDEFGFYVCSTINWFRYIYIGEPNRTPATNEDYKAVMYCMGGPLPRLVESVEVKFIKNDIRIYFRLKNGL
jgi:hypothetical protein